MRILLYGFASAVSAYSCSFVLADAAHVQGVTLADVAIKIVKLKKCMTLTWNQMYDARMKLIFSYEIWSID